MLLLDGVTVSIAACVTVNSEIFARFYFSRNFADAEFCEIKPLRNDKITLSITDVGTGKLCPSHNFLTCQIVEQTRAQKSPP